MKRQSVDAETPRAAARPAPVAPSTADTSGHAALAERRPGPRTLEEVEQRYVAAREAWMQAMRAARSGRHSDLASLALAQEAYEQAAAEREWWMSSERVAIAVEEKGPRPNLEAIVSNELRWRQIHAPHHEPRGVIGRLKRRLTGR